MNFIGLHPSVLLFGKPLCERFHFNYMDYDEDSLIFMLFLIILLYFNTYLVTIHVDLFLANDRDDSTYEYGKLDVL